MGEQPYKKSETFSAQELKEQKDVLRRISQHSATGISSKELVDSFAEYISNGSVEADVDGIDGEIKSVPVAIDERDTSQDDGIASACYELEMQGLIESRDGKWYLKTRG